MTILVTGGAGYIGSHTCVELLNAGYEIIVVDNLMNSKLETVNRISELAGKSFPFYQVDLLNEQGLETVFIENEIDTVLHFAGLKAVGESVRVPLKYYHNNLTGTINLLNTMKKYDVTRLVFSSSATVYGMPEKVPISEDFPLNALNPYGRTKLMMEQILTDLQQADQNWSIALLRYFNPIGAHESGMIGEDPNGVPNNLMPFITQVAVGKLPELQVFGNDYPTTDGTGVRDYIHVVDLARGHVKALEKVAASTGVESFNLGTGKGYSVLEMVTAFEKESGIPIPYKMVEPRAGDAAICFADPTKAQKELNWSAEKNLREMCEDSWRWQSKNPNGYEQNLIQTVPGDPHLPTSGDFSNAKKE
ncbi:UDP-glucose 4-epimerase GalE [Mesobacillus subterraneus]|uniref:UDP-glucose 4-epimerase n=1 Tax=Mesobacillus subterraneus TaxID=285983 RepID=A0A0D6Z9H5_9BACI|nr:UDP-glucose 4-epimerase GalE [Mesobacillus subterraneus]KIY21671.1 UDP-galactose-4-epimerase [Mesobacillus subterraneus]